MTTKKDASTLLVCQAFKAQRLSLSKAAQVAGMSIEAFIGVLGKHGIAVVDYSAEELGRELEILK